jgi:hypothetical protein
VQIFFNYSTICCQQPRKFIFFKSLFHFKIKLKMWSGPNYPVWRYYRINSKNIMDCDSRFNFELLEYKAKTTYTTLSIRSNFNVFLYEFWTLSTMWYTLFLLCTPELLMKYTFRCESRSTVMKCHAKILRISESLQAALTYYTFKLKIKQSFSNFEESTQTFSIYTYISTFFSNQHKNKSTPIFTITW